MSAVFLEAKELEAWMDVLQQCKPLDEAQIKRLCEKVLTVICVDCTD